MANDKCDLARYFGALALEVPDRPGEDRDFVFYAEVFPSFPVDLSTDRIVIRKGAHVYNSWFRMDVLIMYLGFSKARELGLLLLACAFHVPSETTTLTLTHPESEIRRMVIRSRKPDLEDPPVGLTLTPFTFRYWPRVTPRHPWIQYGRPPQLPVLALSNAEEMITREEQWGQRDTVFEESSEAGAVLLAELLLNAGCPENTGREYDLEGEAGCRGVGPMSAELKIVLPGSFPWIYEGDEVPGVPV